VKIYLLDEPELEFGAGRHIDIRFGLKNYGPLDFASNLAPREITVGIVGTSQTVEGVRDWLERCSAGVAAKETPQPYLFPAFPGFTDDTGFRSKLVYGERLQREIHERDVIKLAQADRAALVEAAVELFLQEMRHLVETADPRVIVCALPWSLLDLLAGEAEEDSSSEDALGASAPPDAEEGAQPDVPDFHHLLKARAMSLRKPIQLIKPSTYGVPSRHHPTQLQDEATRAWNIFTALYYKAGGTPWRLTRDPSALTSCYVGVSFFRSRDGKKLETSIAQVFNERGDGVIVRGAVATHSKEDRQTHLSEADAHDLLLDALALYRREHKNHPARVALFKTSRHNDAELAGFRAAAEKLQINHLDLISTGDAEAKLFRHGDYPPLRGTFLSLDDRSQLLYTKGSVEFFSTYPGLYVPQPLGIRCESCDSTPKEVATEVLALTKMNWNNTQFDGHAPITVRAAKEVGKILKYVGGDDPIEPRYAHYM
jgi:hypothetical protein